MTQNKQKMDWDHLGQSLADNLNKNVMLEHIEFVELGISDVDDDYYRALELREQITPNGKFLRLTPKIARAIATATFLHKTQFRKGSTRKIPYISHPLSVAEILAKYASDENTIVAGLLHDTFEDYEYTGYTRELLEHDFGTKIAQIVADVSEDIEMKKNKGEKASWEARKKKYIAHLKESSTEAMKVCCADKIHNLQSMIEAFKEQGNKLWEKFNAPIDMKIWFYGQVLGILKERLKSEMVKELETSYIKATKLFGLQEQKIT